MANINATQEVTIWNDAGDAAVTVDELSTSAKGLSVSNIGYYTTSDPGLIDGQVYPVRISASGVMLTDTTITSTDIDIRDLTNTRDSIQGHGIVTDWGAETPLVPGTSNPLLVTPSGRLLVETYPAPTASGVAQKTIITDSDGNDVNVNADGSLQVTFASEGSSITRMLELRYSETVGLEDSDVWEGVMIYTVPEGYTLEIIDFTSYAGNNTSQARATTEVQLGEYDQAADTFTDGDLYTSPYFGALVEVEVITDTTQAAVYTITYTNQDGTTGRTGTATVPNGSVSGQRFPMTWQSGDYGVTDVTNVTTVGGTAGTTHIMGVTTVFIERMTNSDQTYHQITARESIIIGEGETLELGIKSSQTASVDRYIHVLGQLRSIVGG